MENNNKETGISNMLPYRLEIPSIEHEIEIRQMVNQKELDEIAWEVENFLNYKLFDPDADDWELDGNSIYAPLEINLMHGSMKVTTFMIEIMNIRSIEINAESKLNELVIRANTMNKSGISTFLNIMMLDVMRSFERNINLVEEFTPVSLHRSSDLTNTFKFRQEHFLDRHNTGRFIIKVKDFSRFMRRMLKYEIVQPVISDKKLRYPAAFLPYPDTKSFSDGGGSDCLIRSALASLYALPFDNGNFMYSDSLVRTDGWLISMDEYEFICRKVPLVCNRIKDGKLKQKHVATLSVPYWCIAERLNRRELKMFPLLNYTRSYSGYDHAIKDAMKDVSEENIKLVSQAVLAWESHGLKRAHPVQLLPNLNQYRFHCPPLHFKIGNKYLNVINNGVKWPMRWSISDHAKQVLMADRKRHV